MELVKIIVIVFVGVCFTQASALGIFDLQYPTSTNASLQQKMDAALAVIEEALTKVNTAGDLAKERAQALGQTLSLVSTDARIAAERMVNIADINVQAAISGTVDLTTNFTACVAEQTTELNNLTIQAGSDILGCVTDRVQAAQNIINDVFILAGEAAALGPATVAKIDQCPGNLFPRLLCIVGESTRVTGEVARIVYELTTKVASASALVTNLQLDLQRCVALRVFTFVLKTGQLAGNVGLCVVEAIRG